MTIHPDRRAELTEMMRQIRRLGKQLLRLNQKYLDREREVTRLNQDQATGYTGYLSTVIDNDIILNNVSGAAKTVSTIINGFTSVLQAEMLWGQMGPHERVHVNVTEEYPRGGPMLNAPIATRPQDWAEPARSQLFGERRQRT